MLYAHVEDGSITYMGTLPKSWRNVSNLNKAVGDNLFLKSLGWLPLIEEPATLGENEVHDGWVQSISTDHVVTTEKVRQLTAEEIESISKDAIKMEIRRLEELETPTRLAEAVLSEEGKAWLQANRDLIAAERAKL